MGYKDKQSPSLEKQDRVLCLSGAKAPSAMHSRVDSERGGRAHSQATSTRFSLPFLAQGSLGAGGRDKPKPIALIGTHTLPSMSV